MTKSEKKEFYRLAHYQKKGWPMKKSEERLFEALLELFKEENAERIEHERAREELEKQDQEYEQLERLFNRIQ